MCEPASFIVTKTEVLWLPDSDSHEEIIQRNKLNDGIQGGVVWTYDTSAPEITDNRTKTEKTI